MDMRSPLFWLMLLAILATAYAGPTFVAICRQVDGIGIVIIISIWAMLTLVALPLAWWMAFTLPRRRPSLPHPRPRDAPYRYPPHPGWRDDPHSGRR